MAIIKQKEENTTPSTQQADMQTKALRILHMYPKEMNIYGDYGNIIALKKRAQWRAIEITISQLHIGGRITDEDGNSIESKIKDFDIYFMGGGQDMDQADVYQDLLNYKEDLTKLVEQEKVFLLICGGYQLFGKSFLTIGAITIDGLGLLDIETIGGSIRCIGNIIVDSNISDLEHTQLVGFENHSGRTKILSNKVKTFGRVIQGIGNAETGGQEGGIYKNVYGCYMHGSFLPKNPEFTDMLLQKALNNKYDNKTHLLELDDYIEKLVRERIIKKYIQE